MNSETQKEHIYKSRNFILYLNKILLTWEDYDLQK